MTTVGLRHILIRRWYLVLVGLIAAAGLAVTASIAVPAIYEAKAAVLLLPPTTPGSGSNPYLALSGYQPFADVVGQAMMDTSTVQSLKKGGVTDAYSVGRDITTSGPVLLISVSGGDGRHVVAELRGVVGAVAPTLLHLQQSALVPNTAMLGSKVISNDTTANAVRKSQIRATIAAAAVGALAVLGLIVWFDTFMERRKARRTVAIVEDASPPTDPAVPGPASIIRVHPAPAALRRGTQRATQRRRA